MEKQLPKKLLPFFIYFLKPYKWWLIALTALGIIWAVQSTLTPYFMKLLVNAISDYNGDNADIFDVIKWPMLGYIVVWILTLTVYRLVDFVFLKFLPNLRRDIINKMFAYLGRHSYKYMQNNFAGSLSNKILDMSGSMANSLTILDEAIAYTFALLISLGAMYLVDPLFSLVLLAWAIIFGAAVFLTNKKTIILSHEFSESRSNLSGKIVDAITNLNNVRLFARNRYECDFLAKTVSTTVDKDRAMQAYILWVKVSWDLTYILLIVGMLSGLTYLYSLSMLTVGDFVFILNLSINISMNIWFLASQMVVFADNIGKCSQALTIITADHGIVDAENAGELVVTRGEIKFARVSFAHNDGELLFKDKSVTITPGTRVGLVGFSGSGKTTFVNLIMRLFDVNSGKILIDDQDIAGVTQDSLHYNIAMIPQDISLFHRTLMENIRYGRLDASDDEVIAAAKQSHSNEFIVNLPDGYNTLVGERGIKLSGGQRQRIAIARAMLKNAPILIMDEATSALDSVTEGHIQESLDQLMRGRTSIVVAHRLSTLIAMDRIIVFDNGVIIEDGSHKQLLAKNGHYARMWQMQAGGFLPERDAGVEDNSRS